MGLVFEAEKFSQSVGVPLKEGANAVLDEAIGFHVLADSKIGYKPYVVRVTAVNGSKYKFNFVNCEDGTLVSNTIHEVDANDLDIAFKDTPSSLPSKAQFDSKLVVSFFFLRRSALTGQMRIDADASKVQEIHKWPRTASEVEDAATAPLKATIRRLLSLPTLAEQLGPDELITIRKQIGEEM